jgi:hypothetical protein
MEAVQFGLKLLVDIIPRLLVKYIVIRKLTGTLQAIDVKNLVT